MARSEDQLAPPRLSSLFAFAVVFLLGLLTTGAYMADELPQLEGMWNLRQGDFAIEEPVGHFYLFSGRDVAQEVSGAGWYPGSPFVSLVSLPAYYILLVLDHVLPAAAWLILAWSVAAYVVITRGWSRLYAWTTGGRWKWFEREIRGQDRRQRALDRLRAMTIAHWLVVAALFLWAVGQASQLPHIDYALWGDVFAIQTTHVLLTALAFALFHRWLLHETRSNATASLVALAFLFSPILFWGMGIKYHASTIALAVFAGAVYRLESNWRYAAFPVAALALWSTILALPILASLLVVETGSWLWRMRHEPQGLARQAGIGIGSLAVGLGGLLAYNRNVHDNWLGGRGLRDEQLAAAGVSGIVQEFWSWGVSRIRFESMDRSMTNLWKVFMDGRGLEGDPLALWPMTPIMVLAVAAPWVLWKQRRLSRTAALCLVHTVLFFAVAVHGAHIQGRFIPNLRYFLTSIPFLLILAAIVVRDRVEALQREDWMAALKTLAAGFAASLVILAVLGSNGVALVPGEQIRQLTNAAWIVGTFCWIALLGFQLAAKRTWDPEGHRWWARIAGLSFVAPGLWLFMMTILVTRDIPPYQGADGMSFLMPSLHEFRMWWGPKLIP